MTLQQYTVNMFLFTVVERVLRAFSCIKIQYYLLPEVVSNFVNLLTFTPLNNNKGNIVILLHYFYLTALVTLQVHMIIGKYNINITNNLCFI